MPPDQNAQEVYYLDEEATDLQLEQVPTGSPTIDQELRRRLDTFAGAFHQDQARRGRDRTRQQQEDIIARLIVGLTSGPLLIDGRRLMRTDIEHEMRDRLGPKRYEAYLRLARHEISKSGTEAAPALRPQAGGSS